MRPSLPAIESTGRSSVSSFSTSSTVTSQAFPLRNVEVLQVLDKAKTQFYHLTTILVAGCGFFTDAYDLFSISIVLNLLGRIYYQNNASESPGALPFNVQLAVTATALCGTLLGALFFGALGDKCGRRRVYGVTLILMIVCSVGSGLSFGNTAKSVITTLCFFRFWLGFGIGGDYPLSATIMSEYANVKSRGFFIGSVFALQGFGILFSATASIILSASFNHYIPSPPFSQNAESSTPKEADFLWRIILMIGALPALLTLYFRLRLPETARYTALVEGNILKATLDMQKILDESIPIRSSGRKFELRSRASIFSNKFKKSFGRQLLGTCTAWFLLDVTFYSQNLFQNDVLTIVGWLPERKSMSAGEELFKASRSQALIALCATVPGYWVTVATIEKLGRRAIQLQGFFFLAILTLILGLTFSKLTTSVGYHVLFFILYAVVFFFCNFGPNTTTFIVPAELFPTRLRSTCYGLSAAAGKAGAVVGSFGFSYAMHSKSHPQQGMPRGIGTRGAFLMLAFLNCLGFIVTYLCTPETKGKSLEDLSGEFFDYTTLSAMEMAESEQSEVLDEEAMGSSQRRFSYSSMRPDHGLRH